MYFNKFELHENIKFITVMHVHGLSESSTLCMSLILICALCIYYIVTKQLEPIYVYFRYPLAVWDDYITIPIIIYIYIQYMY